MLVESLWAVFWLPGNVTRNFILAHKSRPNKLMEEFPTTIKVCMKLSLKHLKFTVISPTTGTSLPPYPLIFFSEGVIGAPILSASCREIVEQLAPESNSKRTGTLSKVQFKVAGFLLIGMVVQ